MNKMIAITMVMLGTSASMAASVNPELVDCRAEFNRGNALELKYDKHQDALVLSKDGLNALVLLHNIDGQIRASVTGDVQDESLVSMTAPIPVAKKGEAPFLSLMDFGSYGQIGVFCNLR